MLKKVPSDKINVTKNAFYFLSRAPTHHSFTFNSRFLYELKHKVYLSKTVRGILHFDSVLFLLRWLVGLKLIQLEQQKTQLPFIILAKNLKPVLCRVIKGT